MRRTLLLPAVLLACGIAQMPAQQATNDANPLYRPVSISLHTISVPPIASVPFSATAIIKNKRALPDGSVQATRNINLIGRDSQGRTHGEMRHGEPESSTNTPQLFEVHINDPVAHLTTVYTPANHIATRKPWFARTTNVDLSSPSSPLVKVEDLGTTTIDNIFVKGTRRTVTQNVATGTPLTVVDEYWYSEDLHLNILLLHNDPRTGEQTVALSDIKREDPPPSFFEVPADYKIVDMTPSASVLATKGAAGGR